MSETFYPFPRLPKELRDKIWKFAIRSTRPGANFFTISTVPDDQELAFAEELVSDEKKYGMITSISTKGRLSLSAPILMWKSVDASWIHHNPSAYLVDSGVWTARKESRMVMERQSKILKQKMPRSGWWNRGHGWGTLYDQRLSTSDGPFYRPRLNVPLYCLSAHIPLLSAAK
ncbi:hypothetical protein F4677DRAFT_404064 [Hypoxylon crocopeplum]|nr:hypothetical protein F4677DRAFT_404064 [Hypoxylon crocopeplum]